MNDQSAEEAHSGGSLTVPELIEIGEPDGLMARIDAFVRDARWEDMVDLRDRCHEAVERGKQLWGVAHHVDYRLALQGPAEMAAQVAGSRASRFTLGPLTEVAASTHTWAELEPWLPEGPVRAVVALERVVRGEDLGAAGFDRRVMEMPDRLAAWETGYALPLYKPDRVECDPPVPERLGSVALPEAGELIDDPETVEALLDLVKTWIERSNGIAEALAVEGSAMAAIAALGLREARVVEIGAPQAIAIMAWTASNGGAHGFRSGAAAGRLAAWWAGAAMVDLLDAWPPEPNELGSALEGLRWWWWSDPFPSTGWACRIAVEDPDEGIAWVLNAADAV